MMASSRAFLDGCPERDTQIGTIYEATLHARADVDSDEQTEY